MVSPSSSEVPLAHWSCPGHAAPGTGAPDRAPRTGSWVSLWRFRSYLRPYAVRFVSMVVFAGLGIAAGIVVPLVTRAVIDGPIADSTGRACTRSARWRSRSGSWRRC